MILTLVLVGDSYTNQIDETLYQINRFKSKGWEVKVLTDKPELFNSVETVTYENKIFSYFDKLLFPLKIAEKTKENVLYIDHDFGNNLTENFFKKFKKTSDYIFYEKWQKWDQINEKYIPWEKFGDFYDLYYLPLYQYFKKINCNYDDLITIRECFMYFPYDYHTSEIIYGLERIKPIFDYMSICNKSEFSSYGSSEGIGLSYILNTFEIKPILFDKTLNEPIKLF